MKKSRNILDEYIGQATATQEAERQVARLLKGAVVDDRGADVLTRCKALRLGEINVGEDCVRDVGAAEVGAVEIGAAEISAGVALRSTDRALMRRLRPSSGPAAEARSTSLRTPVSSLSW